MGMSPQTGLPHNNRVGDFDPFAIPLIMQSDGQVAATQVLDTLAEEVGLAGAVAASAATFATWKKRRPKARHEAQLALDVFIAEIRRHLGGMLVELGGADAIVFTGGIGENSAGIRSGGLRQIWKSLGFALDAEIERNGQGRSCESAATKAASRCGSCRRMKS